MTTPERNTRIWTTQVGGFLQSTEMFAPESLMGIEPMPDNDGAIVKSLDRLKQADGIPESEMTEEAKARRAAFIQAAWDLLNKGDATE